MKRLTDPGIPISLLIKEISTSCTLSFRIMNVQLKSELVLWVSLSTEMEKENICSDG